MIYSLSYLAIVLGVLLSLAFRADASASGLLSWNSYDSFGGAPNETQLFAQANAFHHSLIDAGYQTLVMDAGWNGGSEADPTSASIDAHGRFIPSPTLWPSTARSSSFAPVTQHLATKQLGLGLFIFRGIPTAAVARNTPILNSRYTARDVALDVSDARACGWTSTIRGLNISHPGAFDYYRSLAQLYLEWNIAVIKADCFTPLNDPNQIAEMNLIANAFHSVFDEQQRSFYIVYSAGDSTTVDVVKSIANSGSKIDSAPSSFRFTSDFWDDYSLFLEYFDEATAYIPFIQNDGAKTARADLDILPFGVVGVNDPTLGAPLYPRRRTLLTQNEQISVFSLWSIFGSPLTIGGDLVALSTDSFTLALLTDPIALAAQKDGKKRHEVFRSSDQSIRVWTAVCDGSASASDSFSYESSVFVAFFNTNAQTQTISLYGSLLGLPPFSVRYSINEAFASIQSPAPPRPSFTLDPTAVWTVTIRGHGARFFKVIAQPTRY